MIDLKTLPEPVFVKSNYEEILNELKTLWEQATGKTLQPAQLERLILNVIAYRENVLKLAINEAAKQNLLAFAKGKKLDHLGALLGVKRLPAQPALTTLRFEFEEPLPLTLLIPKGTQVRSADGKVIFQTKEDKTAETGSKYTDVLAECTQTGTVGNGYEPGTINQLVNPLPFVKAVYNTTISTGGADTEDDEHYRSRIQIAPESFSNAGSKGAYIYWAKTAHQEIVDVAVESPEPGIVNVYPLLKGGVIPGEEVISLVKETLNADKVRPLTDKVQVLKPTPVSFNIEVELLIYKSYTPLTTTIQKEAETRLKAYSERLKSKLGMDIVPEQIIDLLQSIPGVYRVLLKSPSDCQVLPPSAVAIVNLITVNIVGAVDG
ncbi:MAG: baseplate J/gp47 family protein [Desulfurobacteriaceae bacterium]